MSSTTRQGKLDRLTRRISTEHIWVLAVMVGIFVFLNTHPIRPHDFWWHMAAGRHVATTGQIPTVATETFTSYGTPYPAYSVYWLAETAMYLIYSLGGPALTVFIHALVVGAAYALTLWLCYRRTRNWRVAALAAFFAAAMGVNDWNVRPQAGVFWLLPLFLLVQDIYEELGKDRLLAVFPLGMVVWANCHGTFPIGLAAIALWLVEHVWRMLTQAARLTGTEVEKLSGRAAVALGAATLACLANPRGIGIIAYLRAMTTNPIVQNLVPEWMPPAFGSFSGTVFLIGLMMSATILAVSPRRPNARQLLSFLLFGFLALRTSRGITWFGLALAPTLAEHSSLILGQLGLAASGYRPHTRLTRIINTTLVSVIVLSGLLTLPWFKEALPMPALKVGLISHETPVAATEYLLSSSLPGKLYHDLGFGSYLVWAAQPAYPVFVDPRLELYSEELWRDYVSIATAGPRWEDILEDYNVGTLMLSPDRQSRLLAAAENSGNWIQVYEDKVSTILSHK